MRFICDADAGQTWFQIETEAEAAQESELMRHAVEKHFRRSYEEASQSYDPVGIPYIEQDIRRGTHIRRAMPVFLTLRDDEGRPLVTAMLPAAKQPDLASRPVIVGQDNSDPYPLHGNAIAALARHFGITLDRARCYPYRRA
jgi:hypothetical protein